ncbi:zinc finger protein 354A-like [Ahaetulla prasina]|uniref:zinc finger protein 354A-like n=1 Tax=Ahaetulla prasina TaxID=499056 RepID=UPI002648D19D|nr:zinc finger protein 354A-like [Ahaetulla prasina]
MATPGDLTSSPNETQKVPEGLPASEEPVGKGSKAKVPPKGGDSCPVKSSRRSTLIKPYKRKERRTTFHGDTGLAKHLKGHARYRSYKCVICEKSFGKKSGLLIHQWSHTHSKGLVGLEYGTIVGQRPQLPICNAARLLKATNHDKSHPRKHREEGTYRCRKCMKIFFFHENFIKHQKIHLPPVPGQPRAGNPWIDQKAKPEEAGRDHSELLLEELTKMRQNFDLLILNQQAQLQVLQGIQRQLNILLPGNDLINSNISRLGLLLSQQAAAMRSISLSFFFNPRNLLPESAPPFSS